MTAPGQDSITSPDRPASRPPFARIVCGVNGTRMSHSNAATLPTSASSTSGRLWRPTDVGAGRLR